MRCVGFSAYHVRSMVECGHSTTKLANLTRIYARYYSRVVVIITVDVTSGQERSEGRETDHVREEGLIIRAFIKLVNGVYAPHTA
jgi:hypothetical protein